MRDQAKKVVAFAHFRFTLHGELADCMEGQPCLFVYDLHVDEAVKRKGVAKHLMMMLELIARKANMDEMVVSMPNSPLTGDSKLFMTSGLRGWAEDDLSEVAPQTSEALKDDGSLCVFVKILKSRLAEDVAIEFKPKGSEDIQSTSQEKAESVKSVEKSSVAAQEDDWGIPATSGTATTTPKKKGKGGKKKKNGANKKQTTNVNAGGDATAPVLLE